MIKKYFFIIITITFSSLLPLLLFEFYLKQSTKYPDYETFKYKVNNINYIFNDNPNDYFNNQDKERILFFGDSFTFGAVCAENKEDFVNICKSQVEKESNLKVFNFAAYARGPADYLNLYDHFSEKNLKKLIIVLNYNDITLNIRDCETFKELNKIDLFPTVKLCEERLITKEDRYQGNWIKSVDNFFEHTLLWRVVRNKLYVFPFLRKYYGSSIIQELYKNKDSEQFLVYLNVLKEIKKKADKDKIVVDFVYFPEVIYLKKDNPKIWTLFIDEASKNGIKIKDSWEYFMKHKDSDDMSWSLTDYHPNCKAHKIMANYILENII